MTLRRPVLRDVALLLLALATVLAAGYVLTRTPDGPGADRLTLPTAAPSPSSPEPQPSDVRALFLGGTVVTDSDLPEALSERLGWTATSDGAAGAGFLIGGDGQTLADRVPGIVADAEADVVVLIATAEPAEEADGQRFGGNVQFVVDAVREALPEAQVVLVGPLAVGPDAAPLQRQVLVQVAARFGAFFVDPSGRGYLAGRPELLTADGLPTAEGTTVIADRLAADLRTVLPRTLTDVNDG